MHGFVDECTVSLKAGNGGAGCVSFRHEKYIEKGGPDGGDGGYGGNIYIRPSHKILSLSHIKRDKVYRAENGKPGQGRKCSGRKGKDLYIKVPLGCQLIDAETDIVKYDFIQEEDYLIARGACGGKGNAHFATSTRQTPRFAQEGEHSQMTKYKLSLKLIADIGLVGFPNVGKSTLLHALTKAKPKIANYPFTTLTPNLGVIDLSVSERALIADIPGILEGASKGHGLGLSFLKHIERVRTLVFVLDVTMANVETELEILKSELASYNEELLKRPFLVVFNKVDLIEDKTFLDEWMSSFKEKGITSIGVSATEKVRLKELKEALAMLSI